MEASKSLETGTDVLPLPKVLPAVSASAVFSDTEFTVGSTLKPADFWPWLLHPANKPKAKMPDRKMMLIIFILLSPCIQVFDPLAIYSVYAF
jgi:hypothetical protein